jgi:hypothetical protein
MQTRSEVRVHHVNTRTPEQAVMSSSGGAALMLTAVSSRLWEKLPDYFMLL